MIEGQPVPKQYLRLIGCDSAAHASSFLTFLFPLYAFPSEGAVDKIVFPEGMQTVNFYGCTGLTGKAEVKG